MWSSSINGKLSITFKSFGGLSICFIIYRCGTIGKSQGFQNIYRRSAFNKSINLNAEYRRLRNIRSIRDLRSLHDKTSSKEPCLSIFGLPTIGQLYILRILESSGVLWQPLDRCIILEEAKFAHSALWRLLKSAEDLSWTNDVSNLKSKHIVGLIWLLVKISSNIYFSVDKALVDTRTIKAHRNNHLPTFIDNIENGSSLHSARFLLSYRSLRLAVNILLDFKRYEAQLNKKDLLQLLMLSCERLLLEMQVTEEASALGPDDVSGLESEILIARFEALKCIEELATSYNSILSDSELTSVFVSCCTKEVSDSFMKMLSTYLCERSNKGYLDISLRECITLLNSSKTEKVPRQVLRVLMSQLESFPFREITDSPMHWGGATDNPFSYTSQTVYGSFSNDNYHSKSGYGSATVTDLGRLCKSLYHLSCSKKLLRNLDLKLSSLLSSFTFCRLLITREESDKNNLNAGVMTMASIVHLFARNGFTEWKSVGAVIDIIPTIPWDDNSKNEMTLLGDLCWSLLTLKVDLDLLRDHLERVIFRLANAPLKQTVKMLGGLYNYLGEGCVRNDADKRFSSGRETMDEMLIYTLQSHMKMPISEINNKSQRDSPTSEPGKGGNNVVKEYIKLLKCHFMNRIEEVDDVQCISNFMFYMVSTLDNMTVAEYSTLCSQWIEISNRASFTIRVEALSQVLWSVQRNRIYHEAFLLRVRQLLSQQLRFCTMGQLALVSHTLATFNLLDEAFVNSMFRRVERLALQKDSEFNPGGGRNSGPDLWDTKLVSVVWAVVISDFTAMGIDIIRGLINLLRYVDWDLFLSACQHQDLRKILQINTSLKVELPASYSYIDEHHTVPIIPEYVISSAIKSSQTLSNVNVMSVSQDKMRRSLSTFGVRYQGEWEIYDGIRVDFALDRNATEEFKPDLVIEMDGPHHHNVVCGDCRLPFLQIGPLRLLPSGKTTYRNRILEKLGYSVETINWIDAHRRPIHHTLSDILKRHNYPVNVKQKD